MKHEHNTKDALDAELVCEIRNYCHQVVAVGRLAMFGQAPHRPIGSVMVSAPCVVLMVPAPDGRLESRIFVLDQIPDNYRVVMPASMSMAEWSLTEHGRGGM